MRALCSAFFVHPFLGRGFRPFFSLGALYGALSVFLWILYQENPSTLIFDDAVLWHGHEMIFGFTVAIIAGFLLTAVANWTGNETAKHVHLFLLCVVWIAGRVAMNVPDIDYRIAAVIDLSFIPVIAVSLAVPLLRSWNKRNFVFLLMLTILFSSNLCLFVYQDRTALYVAVFVVLAMISLIGGRIIPAFTVAALRRGGDKIFQKDQPKLDVSALVSLVCILASVIFAGFQSPVTGALSFISAAIHLWRFRCYHTDKVWLDPMLWSLHLGYLWLVAGLILMGMAGFDLVVLSAALHAFTTGCIGTMTLSMMCRVALGHTGRNLVAKPLTVFMFASMQVAAVTRVFGPLFLPDFYGELIMLSGGLWTLVFALYLFAYFPMLWCARPDGRMA